MKVSLDRKEHMNENPQERTGLILLESKKSSGWGTHVYLWWIHFDIWQNQYNIVKLKIKLN